MPSNKHSFAGKPYLHCFTQVQGGNRVYHNLLLAIVHVGLAVGELLGEALKVTGTNSLKDGPKWGDLLSWIRYCGSTCLWCRDSILYIAIVWWCDSSP
mmetsp:Transcript_37700/g.87819  ORF Transcript_37700/g.87819 Transcript_37700/m.87819 type:complete len:98 (-) Transcript_37700:243-536(-)